MRVLNAKWVGFTGLGLVLRLSLSELFSYFELSKLKRTRKAPYVDTLYTSPGFW